MSKKVAKVIAGAFVALLLTSCGSKAPVVKVTGDSSSSEKMATPSPTK